MHKEKQTELSVGLFILLALFALFFVTIQTSTLKFINKNNAYILKASFSDINGLRTRAPVRISGVKIGEVTDISLNNKNYLADVTLVIYSPTTKVPDDSEVSIFTEGVVGTKFLSIEPGFSDDFLAGGQIIEKTRPSLAIEKIINEAIAVFSSKE